MCVQLAFGGLTDSDETQYQIQSLLVYFTRNVFINETDSMALVHLCLGDGLIIILYIAHDHI